MIIFWIYWVKWIIKIIFTFFFYFFECGFLENLKLCMWFIHIFPLDGVPLRSRVGNIETPASVTGTMTLGHQTMITINYTPYSIPGLFRMDDHWGAVDAFIQVSEFGRIIGLWNKNSSDSPPALPSFCTIHTKEVEKLYPVEC